MTSESPESTRTEFTLNDEDSIQSTCWPRRIPLRMGFILVLCATAPILIALTTTYILFGTVWNKSEKCETICNVMEDARKSTNNRFIIFDSVNWAANKRPSVIVPGYDYKPLRQKEMPILRTFCREEKSQFPFVAALLESLYIDDGQDQIVKCPMAVISKEWVLTTEECVGDSKTKINLLSVRLNSDYWAKGGFVKTVKTVMSFKKLIAIRMRRLYGETAFCYSPVKVREDNQLASLSTVHTFMWNSSLSQPLRNRNKFSKLERVEVKIQQLKNVTGGYNGEANSARTGSPFFDQNEEYLIGFQSKDTVDGQNVFVDVSEYVSWLEFIGAIKHV